MSVEKKLAAMRARLLEPDRADGDPIIPEGPLATPQDSEHFQRLCKQMDYCVVTAKAGEKVATSPRLRLVRLPRGHHNTGLLTDEYLHVWNNCHLRGAYIVDATKASEHRQLAGTYRQSGSTNDRQFHKLELENFIGFIETHGESIPCFVWRTF